MSRAVPCGASSLECRNVGVLWQPVWVGAIMIPGGCDLTRDKGGSRVRRRG
jgi:hypothetical protein